MWSQLEPTAPHISYLTISIFLILYALFSLLIRNRLHLSEPPLAVLYGIILGPAVLHVLSPHQNWGLTDNFTQEFTRVILAIQCFAVGIELPAHWFNARRHWLSIALFLGPIMTISWAVTSLFAYWVFKVKAPTAMLIGACLSPTDPVLAASVLGESRFSDRVPKRLRNLLAAESACNDGASFPFLYIGLSIMETRTAADAIKEWLFITVLYQCLLGLIIGYVIGWIANYSLRFSESRGYINRPSLVVFYLLLAVLSVGVGSILGLDDFLVTFGAGIGFAHDGWFSKKAEEAPGQVSFIPIVDLVLNSSIFVYFGSIIPWKDFTPEKGGVLEGHIGIGSLFMFLALVLLFRRIPAILLFQVGKIIPDVKTYKEALFCGHFGPMGVGALFLAIEARAKLETGEAIPLPQPEKPVGPPYDDKTVAISLIWPVICFVVLGSSMVHGLSVLIISLVSHFSRKEDEQAPLLGGERQGFFGMVHDHEDETDDEDN